MIKKDKLNIDSFKNEKGKNYRKAEEIDLEYIKEHIKDLGYNTVKIDQQWRHVHAHLKKNDRDYFFKMSSTADIGERTRNEVTFYDSIKPIIAQKKIDFLDVPQIYKTGIIDSRFYYISEYYKPVFLATKDPIDTSNLESWLDRIVKINKFLSSIDSIHLERDKGKITILNRWQDFKDKKINWYEQVKEHGLDDIMNLIWKIKDDFQTGLVHGDFVPWHMIKSNGKIILIDPEHSSLLAPKYYDVAYFYHRVYVSTQNPILAKKYLKKYKQSLGDSELKEFDQLFKPVLADRILGGYWDQKTDDTNNYIYCDKIKKDLLNNNLI